MAAFDVIVAGVGAMGSAAAFHLAKSGRRVLGLDRFTPPHALGSSHGQTRIIREAYFEHPAYVPMIQRAYTLWDDLAKASSSELFVQTGGLMIGPAQGTLVSGAQRSATIHKLEHQVLSANEIRQRSPALQPAENMIGIWEPRAGVLFPDLCIAAHLAEARKHGATFGFDEPLLHWEASDGGVRVVTTKGEYFAERLVLSVGSWLVPLLPELNTTFTVERQVLFWFEAGHPQVFKPEQCPIHIWEYAPEKFFYGFPDLGQGVKVARHHEGEITSADTVSREVAPGEVEAMRNLVRPFLPQLSGNLRSAAVCMYTNTPDGHFLIDQHPEHPQVLIASPCSGHGFKFSSVIGEIVCDLIQQGRSRFDLSLFQQRR